VTPEAQAVAGADVLLCGELPEGSLEGLFGRFGIRVERIAEGEPIPGSYWGEPEAGILGNPAPRLLVRRDTPVQSALHEGCHLIAADASRRAVIHTDAGGPEMEENGVCYLQILLADHLPGVGRDRMMADMDAWGYSFRLGSTRAWFEGDAEDARTWLEAEGLIDDTGRPTFRARS
jgi:hypothetical protein